MFETYIGARRADPFKNNLEIVLYILHASNKLHKWSVAVMRRIKPKCLG